MSEIEKIKQYIDKYTPAKSHDYDIMSKELLALAVHTPRIDAVLYAFAYGRAKGYHAAKVEKEAAV